MGISSIDFNSLAQSFQNQQQSQPAQSNTPTVPPNSPGSLGDLENIAGQAPQQLGRALQTQQQPQPDPMAPIVSRMAQQSQVLPPLPQQLNPDNIVSPLLQQEYQKYQQMQPKPATGVKGFLSNFFQGMGGSMMAEAGLTPPTVQRQQQYNKVITLMNLYSGEETRANMQRYRDALTQQAQQNAAFEAQSQPLRLQLEQQQVAAGAQNATTVHPAMSAADLKSLGLSDGMASFYAGKPLTSGDFASLRDLANLRQSATRLFDYGQDGTGQGKGQWLVDKDFNPIKQVSPISESGRATALQRMQFQQQQALLKGANQLVVAFDPTIQNPDGTRGGNVVIPQGQAQQRGLTNFYKADPATINSTVGGFNDVQTKINMLADVTNDPNRMSQVQPGVAAAMLAHGKGITLGAFGTSMDPSRINEGLYADDVRSSNQATRDYVAAMGAAHEAMTQLPRLQTFGKSSRMTQQQMEAAQNLLPQPGDAANPAFAQQKMDQLQTTLDPLRKQLPRMEGAELIPSWKELRRNQQTSVMQSTGQQQSGTPLLDQLSPWQRKMLGLLQP